ncbi:MAG: hypothetical protein KAH22_08645 [Thiotrichaceae bacterium]|nr:hypothetical protein [Thiotrichaceae bacterium]
MKTLLATIAFISVLMVSQFATGANHNTTRSNQTNGVTDQGSGESTQKKATPRERKGRNPQTGREVKSKSWEDATAKAVREASK